MTWQRESQRVSCKDSIGNEEKETSFLKKRLALKAREDDLRWHETIIISERLVLPFKCLILQSLNHYWLSIFLHHEDDGEIQTCPQSMWVFSLFVMNFSSSRLSRYFYVTFVCKLLIQSCWFHVNLLSFPFYGSSLEWHLCILSPRQRRHPSTSSMISHLMHQEFLLESLLSKTRQLTMISLFFDGLKPSVTVLALNCMSLKLQKPSLQE